MAPWRIAIAVVVLCFSSPAISDPIPEGRGEQKITLGEQQFEIFTYRPPNCAAPSLMLLFHGKGGAQRYRNDAIRLADKTCMIVVVPHFNERRFPPAAYQRGGIVRKGRVQPKQDWTVNVATELADWARKETGIKDYSLIAHSAGAQFLSRVAAFAPTEAMRIVIANPSSYVLPSLDVAAPYGLGGVFAGEAAQDALRRYLGQPLTIYLGESDDDEDSENLSRTPEAMAQGKTRYQRGLNAFAAGKQAAAKAGVPFGWRLVEVPGVGHNARKMFSAPQAIEALKP